MGLVVLLSIIATCRESKKKLVASVAKMSAAVQIVVSQPTDINTRADTFFSTNLTPCKDEGSLYK